MAKQRLGGNKGSFGRGQVQSVLSVKVIPRAPRNEITGYRAGYLRVKITSPPVRGKANHILKGLIANQLGVPKTAVCIVSGEHSRVKRIEILGVESKEVRKRLGFF
jgi:uncharacterized protein (TIGR00251 family)